jgi:hypothetical protein
METAMLPASLSSAPAFSPAELLWFRRPLSQVSL